MPSRTTTRGLLGHFPYGADLPAIEQHDSTPPVRLPTYFSFRAILAAGERGRGAWGSKCGRRSLRDGGAGGKKRYREGRTGGELGTETRTTAATTATMVHARGGQGQDHNQVSSAGARGGVPHGGSRQTGECRRKRQVERRGIGGIGNGGGGNDRGGCGVVQQDADSVGRGAQESGVGGLSGDAAEGRGNTGKAASAAANEAGAGSRQGQKSGLRGGITIQQENP